jgi:hypothetical protein
MADPGYVNDNVLDFDHQATTQRLIDNNQFKQAAEILEQVVLRDSN